MRRLYRLGYEAAFRLRVNTPPFDEARSVLRDRHGTAVAPP